MIGDRAGVGDGVSEEDGNPVNQVRLLHDFARAGIVDFLKENLVAGRDIVGISGGGRGGVDEAEFEAGRAAKGVGDVGVVAGGDAGELNFDAVVADGTNNRFADAEAVGALANDLDGFFEKAFALERGSVGLFGVLKSESEGNAAAKVESELEVGFGVVEQFGEDQLVATLDVFQRFFHPEVRIELVEVDALVVGDFAQRGEHSGSFLGGGFLLRAIHQGGKLLLVGCGLLQDVFRERSFPEREEIRGCPSDDGASEQKFPDDTSFHEEGGEMGMGVGIKRLF